MKNLNLNEIMRDPTLLDGLSVDELSEIEVKTQSLLSDVSKSDPFWTFTPNNGTINDAGHEFLLRYLKPEDIPTKVDSQLDAILSHAPINGVSGGNRSGKTVTGTIKRLIQSTGEVPIGLEPYERELEDWIRRARSKFIHGRVTGVDAKQLHRVVLPAWKYWVPRRYLLDRSWEKSYNKEFDILTLYRDRKPCAAVEFLTNEQRTESSQGGDLDWANFDEETEQDKYKETLMRFGTAEQLDIEMDWTPTRGLTWATDLFHLGVQPDSDGNETDMLDKVALFKITPVCNPHVNIKTLTKIMDEFAKVSSYEEMKMRLLGEAISLSGLVYGGVFDAKKHIIPPFDVSRTGRTNEDQEAPNGDRFLVVRGLDPHLVTPTAAVFIAIDREGIRYVCDAYSRESDTDEFKKAMAERCAEKGYRLGWSTADQASDTSILAFGGKNMYQELTRGENRISGLRKSIKFDGSIKAGVDEIKRALKGGTLFFFDTPEVRQVVNALRTLEKEPDSRSMIKDKIKEGKKHLHAALRYPFQFPMSWYPEVDNAPEPEFVDEEACF